MPPVLAMSCYPVLNVNAYLEFPVETPQGKYCYRAYKLKGIFTEEKMERLASVLMAEKQWEKLTNDKRAEDREKTYYWCGLWN